MIITSFNGQGYAQYGKTFLETWKEHVDRPIVVYSEDDIDHEGVEVRDLRKVPGFNEFNNLTQFEAMKGKIWGKGSNYRYNINKFFRKSFAQIHAASEQENGLLYWIDSDVEIKGDLFQGVPSFKSAFMMYLGRTEWHSCASFVGWNLDHQISNKFWEHYWKLYLTGTVFCLPEWHDSFILDWLRQELKIPAIDLSNGMYLEGPANVFDEVFGEWAHHKKGNLKNFRNRYDELLQAVKTEKPRTILEVGAWNGRRAVELCKSVGADYIGFDLFEEATDQTDSDEKNVKKHFSKEDVEQYLKENGVSGVLVKGNTRETLPGFKTTELVDLAFIDGGHSIETIRSDYEAVKKLVRPGGLIIFDDYYEGIDTSEYGANEVIKDIPHHLGVMADPVVGGGTTRLAYVRNQ